MKVSNELTKDADIPYPEFSELHENSPRVIVSAGDFPVDLPENSTADIADQWKMLKVGNMSRNYGQFDKPELNISAQDFKNLSPEEQAEITMQREAAADKNLVRFFEHSGIDPQDVVIMKPQMDNKQPVGIVDADHIPPRGDSYIRSDEPATMLYSHKPDRALVALTGDSPFMVGHGISNEGEPVQFLINLSWRTEEAGYVQEALEYAKNTLGVDLSQTHFVITPGAEKLDFTKREGEDNRFTNPGWENNIRDVTQYDEGFQTDSDRIRISMVGFATDLLQDMDIESRQIFVHGSDVTNKNTPYSSDRKTKASNGELPITRDAVVATMPNYPEFNEIRERVAKRRGRSLGRTAVHNPSV